MSSKEELKSDLHDLSKSQKLAVSPRAKQPPSSETATKTAQQDKETGAGEEDYGLVGSLFTQDQDHSQVNGAEVSKPGAAAGESASVAANDKTNANTEQGEAAGAQDTQKSRGEREVQRDIEHQASRWAQTGEDSAGGDAVTRDKAEEGRQQRRGEFMAQNTEEKDKSGERLREAGATKDAVEKEAADASDQGFQRAKEQKKDIGRSAVHAHLGYQGPFTQSADVAEETYDAMREGRSSEASSGVRDKRKTTTSSSSSSSSSSGDVTPRAADHRHKPSGPGENEGVEGGRDLEWAMHRERMQQDIQEKAKTEGLDLAAKDPSMKKVSHAPVEPGKSPTKSSNAPPEAPRAPAEAPHVPAEASPASAEASPRPRTADATSASAQTAPPPSPASDVSKAQKQPEKGEKIKAKEEEKQRQKTPEQENILARTIHNLKDALSGFGIRKSETSRPEKQISEKKDATPPKRDISGKVSTSRHPASTGFSGSGASAYIPSEDDEQSTLGALHMPLEPISRHHAPQELSGTPASVPSRETQRPRRDAPSADEKGATGAGGKPAEAPPTASQSGDSAAPTRSGGRPEEMKMERHVPAGEAPISGGVITPATLPAKIKAPPAKVPAAAPDAAVAVPSLENIPSILSKITGQVERPAVTGKCDPEYLLSQQNSIFDKYGQRPEDDTYDILPPEQLRIGDAVVIPEKMQVFPDAGAIPMIFHGMTGKTQPTPIYGYNPQGVAVAEPVVQTVVVTNAPAQRAVTPTVVVATPAVGEPVRVIAAPEEGLFRRIAGAIEDMFGSPLSTEVTNAPLRVKDEHGLHVIGVDIGTPSRVAPSPPSPVITPVPSPHLQELRETPAAVDAYVLPSGERLPVHTRPILESEKRAQEQQGFDASSSFGAVLPPIEVPAALLHEAMTPVMHTHAYLDEEGRVVQETVKRHPEKAFLNKPAPADTSYYDFGVGRRVEAPSLAIAGYDRVVHEPLWVQGREGVALYADGVASTARNVAPPIQFITTTRAPPPDAPVVVVPKQEKGFFSRLSDAIFGAPQPKREPAPKVTITAPEVPPTSTSAVPLSANEGPVAAQIVGEHGYPIHLPTREVAPEIHTQLGHVASGQYADSDGRRAKWVMTPEGWVNANAEKQDSEKELKFLKEYSRVEDEDVVPQKPTYLQKEMARVLRRQEEEEKVDAMSRNVDARVKKQQSFIETPAQSYPHDVHFNTSAFITRQVSNSKLGAADSQIGSFQSVRETPTEQFVREN